jgi:hypothetical protein
MPSSLIGQSICFCKLGAASSHKTELISDNGRSPPAAGRCDSLIHAAGEKSAVDREQMTGYESGCIRRQENRGSGNFIRLPEAAHRSPHQ